MPRRRCDFEGCRSWARSDTTSCLAHAERQPQRVVDPHGLYAAYVSVADLKSALQLPAGDLRLEIAVVRQVLVQLLAADLPPTELIVAVDKATAALVRMLKANKQSEETAGELETAVEQYLSELGLGHGGA